MAPQLEGEVTFPQSTSSAYGRQTISHTAGPPGLTLENNHVKHDLAEEHSPLPNALPLLTFTQEVRWP